MAELDHRSKSYSVPLWNTNRLKHDLPLDQATKLDIQLSRKAIRGLLNNQEPAGRLVVVVGPCSIHDPEEALDYADLLSRAAEIHHRELLIVMRVYVEKPRSTVGWKGLIHDPDHAQTLGRSNQDLNRGIFFSRKVMLDVAKKGLPIATELLNPLLPQFFKDIVSLGVIGARTTESQTHREMASDMPMPVGFKNGTDGGVAVALNAMTATARPQTVIGVDDKGHLNYRLSRGNPDTFLVLRGGSQGPNFSADHIRGAVSEMLRGGRKDHKAIMVDCSHGNSMKDYRNQAIVADVLAEQIAAGAPIAGVMLESNIKQGRQNVSSEGSCQRLEYGVSITDGCVGWRETESILSRLAAAVRQRHACSTRVPSMI